MTPSYNYKEGIVLSKFIVPISEVDRIKKNLPDKFILHVYGLAGVGKGTLTKSLSELLDLPLFETSLIYRATTFVYHDLMCPLTKENTDKVFSLMDAFMKDGELFISYKSKPIDRSSLKNSYIDTHVAEYSADEYIREKTDKFVSYVLLKVLEGKCITDARGAYPPYLEEAEEEGFLVAKINLYADFDEKVKRMHNDYIKHAKKVNPHFDEDSEESSKFYEESRKTLADRDGKDIETHERLKIGLISSDSGVIDTTEMTVDEVIGTALHFVGNKIGTYKDLDFE
jgi:cytidylate kinase